MIDTLTNKHFKITLPCFQNFSTHHQLRKISKKMNLLIALANTFQQCIVFDCDISFFSGKQALQSAECRTSIYLQKSLRERSIQIGMCQNRIRATLSASSVEEVESGGGDSLGSGGFSSSSISKGTIRL